MNKDVTIVLFWLSVLGCTPSGVIYLDNAIQKPMQLLFKALQNISAYDFYTPDLYRLSVVFAVDQVSKIITWIDRFIVEGAVNLVRLASIFSRNGLKYSTSG